MGVASLLSIKKSGVNAVRRRTPRQLPHDRGFFAGLGYPWGANRARLISCAVIGAIGVVFLSFAGCSDESDLPLGPDPTKLTMSFDEAVALAQAQRFDEAIEALRPFVSKPHPSTKELLVYARSLVGARRNSLAVWYFQRALERDDAPARAGFLYTQALVFGGDELAAIEFATERLDENPDDQAFLEIRSQAYEVALDLERAVEDLEIIVDENPNRANYVQRLLNLLLKLEDWDSSRERMNQLEELLAKGGATQEAKTSFCATAAQFEQQHGELADAEAKLRGCLEQYPADRNLVFAMEQFLDSTERVDEATEMVVALAAEYPKRQVLQQGYANRLIRIGKVEEAEAVLLALAEADDHANSWTALANLRLSRKDLDGTVVAMDRAILSATEKSPDDPDLEWSKMLEESRFGIGDVYVRAGKIDRAERIIASLDEDEPGMALLLRARIKLEQGDPQGALEDYQEAFKTFPSNPAARYLAGRAAIEVGEFDLATDLYQDALRSDPMATDAGLVMAQMLLGEGRINWALDALSFQLARGGTEPFVARVMARAAAAGAMHGFAEGLRAEMAKYPQWAGLALSDQARDIRMIRDAAAAREYLADSEQLDEASHYEAFWAWVKLSLGEPEEAAARAREAAFHKAQAESMGAWIVRGRLLFEDEKKEEAVVAMEKAVELNPLSVTALSDLGEMLIDVGRVDEGVASLDRARDLEPREPRYWFAAARGLFEAERYDEAEVRIEELLVPHPWHGRAALLLIDIARNRGELDGDEIYLVAQRAARYHVVSGPRAFFELAQLDLVRENYEDALIGFERSAKSMHNVANSRFGMGRALAKIGREADAITQIELALTSKELADPLVATALLEELTSGETN